MFLLDLLFVFMFALLLTALFGAGFCRHRDSGILLGFFIVLFLAIWAGGIWIVPFGPYLWGVPWLTFLLMGLLMALLLSTFSTPDWRPRTRAEAVARAEEASAAVVFFNVFFWILVVVLIVAIIARYVSS